MKLKDIEIFLILSTYKKYLSRQILHIKKDFSTPVMNSTYQKYLSRQILLSKKTFQLQL